MSIISSPFRQQKRLAYIHKQTFFNQLNIFISNGYNLHSRRRLLTKIKTTSLLQAIKSEKTNAILRQNSEKSTYSLIEKNKNKKY